MQEYIRFILHNFSFENTVQADMVLKKHYETVFEIFDHRIKSTQGRRPWSGIAALPNNTPEKNPIANIVDEYYESGIKDILGITFFEYIRIPRTVAEGLCEKTRAIKKRLKDEETESASSSDAILKKLLGDSNRSPGANPALARSGRHKEK